MKHASIPSSLFFAGSALTGAGSMEVITALSLFEFCVGRRCRTNQRSTG